MNYVRFLMVVYICFFVAVASANDTVSPGSGALKGIILNKGDNTPVSDFEICALQVEKDKTTSEVKLNYFIIDGKGFPKTRTNSKGEFIISYLPRGMYAVTSDRGLSSLIKDNAGNPRAFEINKKNQTVDLGKIILDK